jgi:predicted nucleic acid-binding protein
MGSEHAAERMGGLLMETTILDTDILIDAAKGVEDAIQCLLFFEKQTGIGISIVTFMELVVGCRDKTELRKTDRFLKKFKIFPLDPSVCNTALDLLKKYRLSHGLMIPDALIGATALVANLPFITKNQKDYRFIPGLSLLPYPYPKTEEETRI